jgi:hypothetical protein
MPGRNGSNGDDARSWSSVLAADPVPWIEASGEPAARWLLLTGVLQCAESEPAVVAARRAVLADDGTLRLVDQLREWQSGEPLSGHDSPKFSPNVLGLLADMGVRRGDFDKVDLTLDQMLAHQDPSCRFESFAPPRGGDDPAWSSLLCDHHAVLETLVRYGHGTDPRVVAGLERMLDDVTDTGQGRAWPCRPDAVSGFRGPGRTSDFCPQVTVEALRVAGRVPGVADQPQVVEAVRTLLSTWSQRDVVKPYMFGHGRTFKTVKWPPTWYRVDAVLDAVGRFPSVWTGPRSRPSDRRAVTELLACLISYNFDGFGRVTPRSAYKGFEAFSFGQKKTPSAFATARLLSILQPFEALAIDTRGVDVAELTSSKGGTGIAMPPRAARRPR